MKLISTYLDLLQPDGILVIAQAREKVLEPSVSFSVIKSHFMAQNYKFVGPYMLYLYKHFRFRKRFWLIKMLAFVSEIVAFLLNLRLIAYFVVYKPK